jgi:murein L,D-transpeptidase YafK
MLAACNPDTIPTGRSLAPLSDKMLSTIKDKRMDKDSPILVRLFKEESELEVWKKNQDGEFALLKTYPICRWSGDLGPKIKEGDRQAPEGFYTITPGQMNPNSNYYLAFNTGYPNSFDRAWGRTGSELMVHGDCSSRGCYAMTDEQIQEIYALARESFYGGQKEFQFEAFPFRMTALNMAKHRNNPNFPFWKMIKEGYDDFEAAHQEPKVAVCEKRYVFDAAPPANASRPLRFDPRGKCPVFQLDPSVADSVLDHRRHEEYQMAQYIAERVATVPPRADIDGGMNPVFASQIGTQEGYDRSGRLIQVATAPGALPRTPTSPPVTEVVTAPQQQPQPQQNSQPVVMASVPMPQPAPQPKEGEAPLEQKPSAIAGLLGNLFGGSTAKADTIAPDTIAPDTDAMALRGSTEVAAKPKRATTFRTASAPAVQHAKPREAAVASAPAPERKPRVQQAEKQTDTETARALAPAREMRTAEQAPPAGSNGLLAGAQPVVPVGSFDSRWSGLR